MRNLIITLLLIVCSMVSIGQTFKRATYYEVGVIDTVTMDVEWGDKVKMEPVLVTFNSRNVKIHSEKFQQYFYKGPKYELAEVKGHYYYSYTAEGKECVIYFYTEVDGTSYLEIEKDTFLIKYHLIDLE